MKPIVPPWLSHAAYIVGICVVFLAAAAYLAQAYLRSRECEERGGVPVYGRCAQPMPEKP